MKPTSPRGGKLQEVVVAHATYACPHKRSIQRTSKYKAHIIRSIESPREKRTRVTRVKRKGSMYVGEKPKFSSRLRKRQTDEWIRGNYSSREHEAYVNPKKKSTFARYSSTHTQRRGAISQEWGRATKSSSRNSSNRENPRPSTRASLKLSKHESCD